MSGEWKPGEVAVIDGEFYLRTGNGWLFASTSGGAWSHAERSSADRVTSLARRVVVVDPEDVAQIERYEDLRSTAFKIIYDQQGGGGVKHVDVAQMAFRQMADPTYKSKPDEPQGLGAVVEDDAGCWWVHFTAKTGNWWRNHQGQNRRWDDLAAVRVLSEGVVS